MTPCKRSLRDSLPLVALSQVNRPVRDTLCVLHLRSLTPGDATGAGGGGGGADIQRHSGAKLDWHCRSGVARSCRPGNELAFTQGSRPGIAGAEHKAWVEERAVGRGSRRCLWAWPAPWLVARLGRPSAGLPHGVVVDRANRFRLRPAVTPNDRRDETARHGPTNAQLSS